MVYLWCVICTYILLHSPGSVEANFALNVHVDDAGNYMVYFVETLLLEGAPPFFIVGGKTYSTTDGSLKLINVTDNSGNTDAFGPWTSRDIYYDADSTTIVASARNYSYGVVSFSVNYVDGATQTKAADENQIICGFPGFKVGTPRTDLGYLGFGGHFTGDTDKSMGKFDSTATIPDGLEGSGPLAIFDSKGATTVITPLDRFMVTSMWHDKTNNYIYWGLMGGLDGVQREYGYQTFVNYNTGINAAMSAWGLIVGGQYYNNTKNFNSADKDITTQYLGYWTDDGSYYGNGPEPGKTYADTIVEVQQQAQTVTKVPYTYFQLDSWWCIKNGSKIKDWKAVPTAIPQGMAGLETATKLKFMMYSGVWSADNVYAKQNGGNYSFIIDGPTALPLDQAFWDDLFKTAVQWGLTTYDQDGMDETFMNMNVTKQDVTTGRTWLQQMNDAAVRNNINILYSDAYPRHLFQSLLLPAVTQTRASPDYGKNKDQWKIGISSIFADALNLIPNKDSFRTSHNGSDLDEPYPELEMVVALLSKGPVGIGDRVNFANSSIIKKCCSTDGKLLQPMRPAKAIDLQIIQSAFKDGSGPDGELWSTYTNIPSVGMSVSGNATYGVIFAAGLTKPFDITPENTHLNYDVSRIHNDFPKSKIYRWNEPGVFYDFSKDIKFTLQNCTLDNFCLYYTAPIIEFDGQEVVILGELDKWIHMPYQRVTQISVTDTIDMEINGAANEEIEIWIAVNGNIGALATRTDGSGLARFKYERKHTNGADYNQFSLKTLFVCVVCVLLSPYLRA